MKLEVKYFGMTNEITQAGEEILDIPQPVSVQSLKETLETRHESLKTITFQIAIDREVITDPQYLIEKDAEIALLPAFAGG